MKNFLELIDMKWTKSWKFFKININNSVDIFKEFLLVDLNNEIDLFSKIMLINLEFENDIKCLQSAQVLRHLLRKVVNS